MLIQNLEKTNEMEVDGILPFFSDQLKYTVWSIRNELLMDCEIHCRKQNQMVILAENIENTPLLFVHIYKRVGAHLKWLKKRK